MSRGIASAAKAGATVDGYEIGDWEFFQEQVEAMGEERQSELTIAKFLAEWQIVGYDDMSADDIVEDIGLIISRLEGAE